MEESLSPNSFARPLWKREGGRSKLLLGVEHEQEGSLRLPSTVEERTDSSPLDLFFL